MEIKSREKINEYFRSYYQRNKDKIKAAHKKYYDKKKEIIAQRSKEKYHNDDEHRQRKLKKMSEYRNRMKPPMVQQISV